jgi:hypothetical protein
MPTKTRPSGSDIEFAAVSLRQEEQQYKKCQAREQASQIGPDGQDDGYAEGRVG